MCDDDDGSLTSSSNRGGRRRQIATATPSEIAADVVGNSGMVHTREHKGRGIHAITTFFGFFWKNPGGSLCSRTVEQETEMERFVRAQLNKKPRWSVLFAHRVIKDAHSKNN